MILDTPFEGPLWSYMQMIFANEDGSNPGKMLYQDDAPEPFLTVPRFQAAIQEPFRNRSK